MAISPDGETLISWDGNEDTIKIWNIERGDILRTFKGHSRYVKSVAISQDDQTVVSQGGGGITKIWNIDTGELLRTFNGHSDYVKSVAISEDGHTVVSASWDGSIKIWNLETGQLLRTLENEDKDDSAPVTSMAITADGKTLVSVNMYPFDHPSSYDKTIKVWNLETGQLLHTLKGHSSYVTSLAISSDDQKIVSGSLDNTIKVWDLETGDLLDTLEGHSSHVKSVAISKDGTIVSGSDDTDIRVWRNQL